MSRNQLQPRHHYLSDEIRQGALRALAKYRFREGIPLRITYAWTQSQWGSQERIVEIMKILEELKNFDDQKRSN